MSVAPEPFCSEPDCKRCPIDKAEACKACSDSLDLAAKRVRRDPRLFTDEEEAECQRLYSAYVSFVKKCLE